MSPARRVPLFVRRLSGPALMLAIVAGVVALLRRLGMPVTTVVVDAATNLRVERNYGALAIGLAAAFLLARLVDYAVFDFFLRHRSKTAPALLRQLLSLAIFLISASVVFHLMLAMRLTALLTTSAIITAVVGLALQDTLGNLFAGLALHMERTVRVGDLVRTGETFGAVEELSWRAIKLRTIDGNVLLVPNSVAGRERLEIFPHPGAPIARSVRIGLEYDASPARVHEALATALRGVPGVAAFPAPAVLLKSFADFSVQYEVRYFLEDYSRYLDVDSAVRERIWYAIGRSGLNFAYPVIRQHQYAAGPLSLAREALEIRNVLESVELFSELSEEHRARLAMGARERRFGPTEIVVREGDAGSSMFLVVSGRVAVSVHGGTGESRRLTILEPGAAFGEISLLTGDPRTATVRAMTETTLLEIEKETLAPILQDHPSLVESLERSMQERRRGTTEALEAARVKGSTVEAPLPLGARMARFFGLRLGDSDRWES